MQENQRKEELNQSKTPQKWEGFPEEREVKSKMVSELPH